MKKLLLGFAVGVGLAFVCARMLAQTANVFVLPEKEAAHVGDVWLKPKAAEQDWATVKAEVKKEYNFECDAEFSRDLKAVVESDQNCAQSHP